MGDPRDENFGFCGDRALPGLPYCAEHAKVAYQAATRNRILQAQEKETVTPEELEAAREATRKAVA